MTRIAPMALAAFSLLVALAPAPAASAQDAAPAELSLNQEDLALLSELLGGLRPDWAAGEDPAEAARIAVGRLAPFLSREGALELLPKWLRWAKAEFSHPTVGWVGDRTATLLVFGPPGGIHREEFRDYAGREASLSPSPWDLMLILAGQEPRSPAETLAIDWEMPVEIWVYPEPDGQHLNLFHFGDIDGDGIYRLLFRERVPAGERVSSAPLEQPPAELFGAGAGEVEVLEGARDLPELTEDPVTVTLDTAFFKATEGRTATRFVVAVDPVDVELELDVDPAAWLAKAVVWLRVERDGEPVYQDAFEPNPAALADLSEGYVDELTTVPLTPGAYRATVVLTDGDGRGGRVTESVELPALGGGLGLSSLILAKAEGGDIPKATGSEEDFVAFRVGNYVVRPHVSGEFRPGDTLALVVQAYDAPSASLEYTLFKDGRAANSLEPVRLAPLPATDIQLIEVLDVWPAGAYAFRVTAGSGPDAPTREVSFRVRK